MACAYVILTKRPALLPVLWGLRLLLFNALPGACTSQHRVYVLERAYSSLHDYASDFARTAPPCLCLVAVQYDPTSAFTKNRKTSSNLVCHTAAACAAPDTHADTTKTGAPREHFGSGHEARVEAGKKGGHISGAAPAHDSCFLCQLLSPACSLWGLWA